MGTSKWSSSLGNAETRLRRLLGIAGPIDLAMEQPARLTPVIITEDATGPGTASSLRGRRFKTRLAVSVVQGSTGSAWLLVEEPVGPSAGRSERFSGGVVIDWLEIMAVTVPAPATIFQVGMIVFPTDLVISPGIPVGGFLPTVFYTDPLRSATEVAPLAQASAPAGQLQTNGGIIVAEWWMKGDGLSRWLVPADMFLNYNSAIAFGNRIAVLANMDLAVNVHGRIF